VDPDFAILDVHHHVGDAFRALGGALEGAATTDPGDEVAARLAIMDRAGVAQALVIPGHAYERSRGAADTRAVNDGIAAYRDALPGRFPGAIGITEPTHGDAGLAELERGRRELGLVGFSFHTRFQGVSLDSRWIARACERMGELGLVPVIHVMDETPEEALWKLAALARSQPDMEFLALDAFGSYESTRQCSFVADVAPNILFDTSLSYNFDFIEEFAGRFGAERVVFGTDLYSHPVGRRISHLLPQILESELSDGQKRAVLGDNARRLFGLPHAASTL
jgi:predicted TIM-barrel fold metal-dependent hydrolase